MCNVVAYAHHKGVVHRDIKPDNIMLGPYGEIVVVDWGLAKLVGQKDEQRGSAVRLSGSGSTATQEGAIVGSPFYMSPEGAKGQPDAVVAQQLAIAERDGALTAATEELQAAIDLGPATAEMWRHLGAVHELRRAPNVAIDAYTRGLELDPKDTQLRNMRAWVHANSHELDAAQSDFEAILDSAPDNAEAHAGLGFVLADLGREDDSRREASVALLAATDNHLLLHNIACIYGRLSSAKPERCDEYENLAIALLQRAMSISRSSPRGLDANEITLLRNGSSFPDSLKRRPEFGGLLEVSRR